METPVSGADHSGTNADAAASPQKSYELPLPHGSRIVHAATGPGPVRSGVAGGGSYRAGDIALRRRGEDLIRHLPPMHFNVTRKVKRQPHAIAFDRSDTYDAIGTRRVPNDDLFPLTPGYNEHRTDLLPLSLFVQSVQLDPPVTILAGMGQRPQEHFYRNSAMRPRAAPGEV